MADSYEAEVERGIELLKLCHKLQSENDGVDRPAPLAIDKGKTLDQFTRDVNIAITWMGSIIQLHPQSQQLADLGRKLEAVGQIEVAVGENYSEVAMAYLCREHGLSGQEKGEITMKLHEVLGQAQGREGLWFRPVSWAGVGQAYTIKEGRILEVPSPRGGRPGMTSSPKLLAGDWETVDPDTVLAERN